MNLLEFIGAGTVLFFIYIIYLSLGKKRAEKIAEDENDIALLLNYHKHFSNMFKDFSEREETKFRERRAQARKEIEQAKKDGIYEYDMYKYENNYINHRGYDLYGKIVWVDNHLIVEDFKKEIRDEIANFNRDKEEKEMMKAILAKVKSSEFKD